MRRRATKNTVTDNRKSCFHPIHIGLYNSSVWLQQTLTDVKQHLPKIQCHALQPSMMERNAIHALHAHLVGQKTYILYSDSSFTEYIL